MTVPMKSSTKGLPQNKVYHSALSVAAGKDRIVPLWVLAVGSNIQVFHLLVADFDPGLVPAFVYTALTRSPRRVVVALIRFTTVSKLTRGSPFQFMLINENIRCSILFHLLVPGG